MFVCCPLFQSNKPDACYFTLQLFCSARSCLRGSKGFIVEPAVQNLLGCRMVALNAPLVCVDVLVHVWVGAMYLHTQWLGALCRQRGARSLTAVYKLLGKPACSLIGSHSLEALRHLFCCPCWFRLSRMCYQSFSYKRHMREITVIYSAMLFRLIIDTEKVRDELVRFALGAQRVWPTQHIGSFTNKNNGNR